MAQRVEGELYGSITGQLFEIGRQLRQQTGYPFCPEKLKRHLQVAILGRFDHAANTFPIICEGLSASTLLKQGQYDRVDRLISDKYFPIEPHTPSERLITIIKFEHDMHSEEVLQELERQGLRRPTFEDALCFGAQHPVEQRRRGAIIFLHEPVVPGKGEIPSIIELNHPNNDSKHRQIVLRWFDYCDGEWGWSNGIPFAGVADSLRFY